MNKFQIARDQQRHAESVARMYAALIPKLRAKGVKPPKFDGTTSQLRAMLDALK